MSAISEKIKSIRQRTGLTQDAFSIAMGEKPSKIRDIEAGRQRVNDDFIVRMIQTFPVDLNWLFSAPTPQDARDAMHAEEQCLANAAIAASQNWREGATPMSDYDIIPLFDAMLSAGPGAQNHGANIASHLAFRRDWLGRIGVPASSACLARITGDSMCPTISPGDMVLIDRAHTEPPVLKRSPTDKRRPPLYAVIEEGEARIKRIERPEPEALILLSDNPEHAPQLRTGAQAKAMQMTIIGKVVWWGHTNKE